MRARRRPTRAKPMIRRPRCVRARMLYRTMCGHLSRGQARRSSSRLPTTLWKVNTNTPAPSIVIVQYCNRLSIASHLLLLWARIVPQEHIPADWQTLVVPPEPPTVALSFALLVERPALQLQNVSNDANHGREGGGACRSPVCIR